MSDPTGEPPQTSEVANAAKKGGEPVRPAIKGLARSCVVILTLAGVALSVHQMFNLQLFGLVLIEGRYLYLLAASFLPITFLIFPARSGERPVVPPYDWALAVLALVATSYFAATAETSLESGWEYAPPEIARWLSVLLWLLILEATRRAGGTTLFVIVALFSIYPTFADRMPDPLSGLASPLLDVVPYHVISAESSFGIPMRAFGGLVIGFIVFGAVLQQTGGGRFFNNLALAMVGGYRGGAAKVAILASGFMGSMSGSVISNVLTTGVVSIPAMKRTGFSARYAAATEACASTGGVLMPPIMGATAFVMASFLSMPYLDIAIAAVIPSILYYFGLFAQIDAYAAKRGLKGLSRAELPIVRQTLKSGWPYLAVFAVLIFIMVALRQETLAPYWATLILLLINQVLSADRLDWTRTEALIYGVGQGLAELTAILLGVGLIVGAFSATGLAGTLVNELIHLAGHSTLGLLAMGALTAFVFGMGMTVTACYIFLAVVLAPALEQAGLNRLAVHLFILYWGMVSYITPPVALGAFTAATLARASPLATGMEAMRLGGVIYVVPFFFVLNPALIGLAPAWEVAVALLTALVGVWFLASALQGYISLIGGFASNALGYALRGLLLVSGLLLVAPGRNDVIALTHWQLAALAIVIGAPALFAAYRNGHREARQRQE